MEPRHCKVCGSLLPEQTKGRPRLTCSDECKAKWTKDEHTETDTHVGLKFPRWILLTREDEDLPQIAGRMQYVEVDGSIIHETVLYQGNMTAAFQAAAPKCTRFTYKARELEGGATPWQAPRSRRAEGEDDI